MTFGTSNLGLKLLAIGIALFLWAVAHGSSSIERGFDVPVVLRGEPEDLVITDQSADVVNVRVLGNPAALRSVTPDKLEYALDVANAKAGAAEFDVDASSLEFPRGARVVARSPARIEVRFEGRATKSVRVRPLVEGEPAPGYEVAGVEVEPARVRVAGARSQVTSIAEATTDPIDVTGLSAPLERDARVVAVGSHVWLEDGPSVRVRVQVRQKPVPPPPAPKGRRG